MMERVQPWLWILDSGLVRTLLAVEPDNGTLEKRAAAHPALVGAMRLWLQRDGKRAMEALGPAIEAGDGDALLLAGQVSFESGDLERAAGYYGRLAAAAPEHRYANLNRGLCLARMREWGHAVESLQKAVTLDPSNPDGWHVLGICLLQERRAAEARGAFEQSLKLRAGYAPALCGAAVALQWLGRAEEALAVYEQVLEVAADVEEVLLNAAGAALACNRMEKAAELAGRALSQNPTSGEAMVAMGQARMAQGRNQEAAEAFEGALGVDRGDTAALHGWAASLLELGRFEEAEEAWRRLPAGSGEAWLACALGLEQHRRGADESALGYYEAALAADAACHEARFNRGCVLARMGRREEAAAEWKLAIEGEPSLARHLLDELGR